MAPKGRAEKDKLSDARQQEMLEQEAKVEATFQKLMREVSGGIAGSEEGMMDAAELLTLHKNHHDEKQAAMYKQWESHVFHNIPNHIAKNLMNLTPDQISKKHRTSPK